MAGMIVCGLVLLIAAVITLVYIMRRRTHRQRLTTQHALDVFLRLMKKEDVRQRIGVLDKAGKRRCGLVTKKVYHAVLEYQRQHTENNKIGKASNLSEDQEDKLLERKAAMERLVKELEKRWTEDPDDTLKQKDLLEVAEVVSEGRSGSAGFNSKRKTFQLIEHAFKAKYHQEALKNLKACSACFAPVSEILTLAFAVSLINRNSPKSSVNKSLIFFLICLSKLIKLRLRKRSRSTV